MQSFNGYNQVYLMDNGVANYKWVKYPLAVTVSKWICLLTLIGVVLAFVGSFIPAYMAYGIEGLKYAATNCVNLIFLPIAVVCILGLKLKG